MKLNNEVMENSMSEKGKNKPTMFYGFKRPADYPSPIPFSSKFDHTYVLAYSPYGEYASWPCHGGIEGGNEVVNGRGDLTLGHCLGDNEAGLSYGSEGVCHQMSNSVLYSIDKTINSAKGANVTRRLFGSYGHRWPKRKKQCSAYKINQPSNYILENLYNKEKYSDTDFIIEEFKLSLEHDFCGQLSSSQIDLLLKCHEDGLNKFIAFNKTEKVSFSDHSYLKSISILIFEMFLRFENIMGVANYFNYFGIEPELTPMAVNQNMYSIFKGN